MNVIDSSDTETYACIYCGKALPIEEGVIVHDDVPHPINITFDEEENPQ